MQRMKATAHVCAAMLLSIAALSTSLAQEGLPAVGPPPADPQLTSTHAPALTTSAAGGVLAQSTFERDVEGWTKFFDCETEVSWDPGVPGDANGGFVTSGKRCLDVPSPPPGYGCIYWHWVAPASFVSAARAGGAYGGLLTFDLKTSTESGTLGTNGLDLMIGGRRASGIATMWIGLRGVVPRLDTDWMRGLSVRLDESQDWVEWGGSGGPVPAADVQSVIATMSALQLRGMYKLLCEGGNGSSLDNVRIVAAGGQPGLSLQLLDSKGAALPDGTALERNADGWPSPNPVTLRARLDCPAGGGTCFGTGSLSTLRVTIDADGDHGLFHTTQAAGPACVAHELELGRDSHHGQRLVMWECPAELQPGESRTYDFGLVVRPSEADSLSMRADWGPMPRQRLTLGIPQAQIHPVILVHGIGGSQPPWDRWGVLDPSFGIYYPLLTQLGRMGYNGLTLEALTYDWRNSNRRSAALLAEVIQEVGARVKGLPYVAQDGTVDVVVHSMGGLVARAYVQGEARDAQDEALPYRGDVRKIVFIATPHRGFPEDYKTYEGTNWDDYLYEDPALRWAMNNILWPSYITKRWTAAHPRQPVPRRCGGFLNLVCTVDYHAMTHDAVGGIDSMREMLPTDDVDQFLGPYLCDAALPCSGAYAHGRPANTLLNGLNANVDVLRDRIGAANLYVIYGKDPEPANFTDVVFDVAPPGQGEWDQGAPEQRFVTAAGDDLIPEYSMNLKLLVPDIPDANVTALSGEAARHKQVMYNPEVLARIVPGYLAGIDRLAFVAPYSKPWTVLDPRQWLILAGLCPLDLIITDPQGRRAGYDPLGGTVLREIPGVIYAGPGAESQFIAIPDPLPGTYTVSGKDFRTNGAPRDFTLQVWRVNDQVTSRRWEQHGQSLPGEQLPAFSVFVDASAPLTNTAPQAQAGPDLRLEAGAACSAQATLDGSASSDADGEVLRHTWAGPFGLADGPRPTVLLPLGTHPVGLTVEDGARNSSFDLLNASVVDRPPAVDAGTDITGQAGVPIAFLGRYFDPAGQAAMRIRWDFGDGGSVEGTLTPTHMYARPGRYTVILQVTDACGSSNSDSLMVEVDDEPAQELCLDENLDRKGLSKWVRKVSGHAGHTGKDNYCGPRGYYYVAKNSGKLRVELPGGLKGHYGLRFRYRAGSPGQNDEALRVTVGKQRFDFEDRELDNSGEWVLSKPLPVSFGKHDDDDDEDDRHGERREHRKDDEHDERRRPVVEFRSIGKHSVHLEQIVLVPDRGELLLQETDGSTEVRDAVHAAGRAGELGVARHGGRPRAAGTVRDHCSLQPVRRCRQAHDHVRRRGSRAGVARRRSVRDAQMSGRPHRVEREEERHSLVHWLWQGDQGPARGQRAARQHSAVALPHHTVRRQPRGNSRRRRGHADEVSVFAPAGTLLKRNQTQWQFP